MTSIPERIAALSPEKREILLSQLKTIEHQQQGGSSQGRRQVREQAPPLRAFDRSGAVDVGKGLAPLQASSPDSTTHFPLSFAQERLWFLNQWDPGSAWYNVPVALRLSGQLQVSALERSFAAVIQRHEALRTTFEERSGSPVQVITPCGACRVADGGKPHASGPRPQAIIQVPVIDLRGQALARCDQQVSELARAETQCPFDLSRGPLLRICLLRLDEQEHVLLFTLHHIITDGWSMEVLMREMTTHYQAEINGEPDHLPELPIQYADYTLWQRQWLQGEILEAQLAYWRKQLVDLSGRGPAPSLQLPTDHPRPAVKTDRGATQSRLLPKAMSEELVLLSQKLDVTLFMLLLGSFQVLLMRYTGQTDISVGTPVANRTQAELEGMIGFFVNTLVMRTDLGGNPTFEQLLRRVREVCLQAYVHQDIPFEKLVEELETERDTSRSPLFQVMLVLQNAPLEARLAPVQDLAGVRVTPLEVVGTTSKFDLTLSVVETERGLDCVLEYSTDLFEVDTIRRMLVHFQTLLQGILQDSQARLSDLPLLTEGERQSLLVEWNATETDYPSDLCLHQLFEQQVRQTPDTVAVVCEEHALTYDELNQHANQLSAHLSRSGIGPDSLVGLCVERSLEMVIGLLGILKAGGAYVPLDPSYPRERLTWTLEDCRPAIVLTQGTGLSSRLAEALGTNLGSEHLPRLPARIIDLNETWDALSHEPATDPPCGVGPGHLAYLIYTSGSTGKPKGVMVTHRSISNNMYWRHGLFQLKPGDSMLQRTPLSFDVSAGELFLPLSSGARVIMTRPEGHKDSAYLLKLLAEQQVTILDLVPSLLQACVEEPELEQCLSLRHVLCGGEALSAELQKRFFARHHASLSNLYGPTEATVEVTCWVCGTGGWGQPPTRQVPQENAEGTVPIGFPIANTQIYLLDAYGSLVPVGVPGEVAIGGVALARGYLNRPDLTAERFLPHPWSTEPGARLYRTGDLAHYRADGAIEYLGRIDQQVKLRGYRIELGEIESVLNQHPGVCAVACVSVSTGEIASQILGSYDEASERQIGAYVVLNPEQPPTSNDLRRYLQAKLPPYMVPSSFVMLDTLPLTPNGKVDRRSLKRADVARSEREVAFVSPRTPAEEVVAEIWAEILNVEQVGVYDNFFALGGHSLRAVQVVSRLRDAFQIELPVHSLFEQPTVDGLVSEIAELRGGYSIIEEIALVLKEIKQLSEEDMQDILNK